MFDGLIDGGLARAICDVVKPEDLLELRLRIGRPLFAVTLKGAFAVRCAGVPYKIGARDIERIIANATDMSVYSVNDEMIRGYIPSKRLRIGIAGEGVLDNGRLISVKNVGYLVIRVPHQIMSAADCIKDKVIKPDLKSVLVVSPPGAGKTTLLRELARIASELYNTVVIDERYEIACVSQGAPTLDIGDCEVVSGIPKATAYESCVRTMSPDLVVTDEIFRQAEVDAVCDIVRSGVKVFASVHGASIDALEKSRVFKPLLDVFDFATVLSKRPRVGTVVFETELDYG